MRFSPKVIFLSVIVVIIATASGVVTAIMLDNDGTKKVADSSTSITSASATKRQSDAKASSPTLILKELPSYVGQEVTLKGVMVKIGSNYYLAGQEAKKPGAIKLDFSKTKINPAKYAKDAGSAGSENPTAPKEAAKTPPGGKTIKKPAAYPPTAITIRGTVTQTKPTTEPFLIVRSVE